MIKKATFLERFCDLYKCTETRAVLFLREYSQHDLECDPSEKKCIEIEAMLREDSDIDVGSNAQYLMSEGKIPFLFPFVLLDPLLRGKFASLLKRVQNASAPKINEYSLIAKELYNGAYTGEQLYEKASVLVSAVVMNELIKTFGLEKTDFVRHQESEEDCKITSGMLLATYVPSSEEFAECFLKKPTACYRIWVDAIGPNGKLLSNKKGEAMILSYNDEEFDDALITMDVLKEQKEYVTKVKGKYVKHSLIGRKLILELWENGASNTQAELAI